MYSSCKNKDKCIYPYSKSLRITKLASSEVVINAWDFDVDNFFN